MMRINKPATIPDSMSKELAEEIGMHLGDGSLRYAKYDKCTQYAFTFTSGADEEDYCLNYVMPLIYKLYSLKPSVYRNKGNNTINLYYKSKKLLNFKKSLGIPVGKKDNLKIPKCVLESDYIFDFIRGLFDTDGCLHFQKKHKKVHYYPRLDISSKCQGLISQINAVFIKNGFTTSAVLNSRNYASNGTECRTSRVYLYGKKNLIRWIKFIGFSNPKNTNKLREWQEKGFVESP